MFSEKELRDSDIGDGVVIMNIGDKTILKVRFYLAKNGDFYTVGGKKLENYLQEKKEELAVWYGGCNNVDENNRNQKIL